MQATQLNKNTVSTRNSTGPTMSKTKEQGWLIKADLLYLLKQIDGFSGKITASIDRAELEFILRSRMAHFKDEHNGDYDEDGELAYRAIFKKS